MAEKKNGEDKRGGRHLCISASDPIIFSLFCSLCKPSFVYLFSYYFLLYPFPWVEIICKDSLMPRSQPKLLLISAKLTMYPILPHKPNPKKKNFPHFRRLISLDWLKNAFPFIPFSEIHIPQPTTAPVSWYYIVVVSCLFIHTHTSTYHPKKLGYLKSRKERKKKSCLWERRFVTGFFSSCWIVQCNTFLAPKHNSSSAASARYLPFNPLCTKTPLCAPLRVYCMYIT